MTEDQTVYNLDGKIYYAEKEQDYISCKGCAFNKQDVADHNFCSCDDSEMINDCYNQQIVWKEVKAPMLKNTTNEEPKFTVEQVLNAALEYIWTNKPLFLYGKVLDEAVNNIKQKLIYQDNTEYQLYLELKSKYES